jgi:glutamine---fructose-6-phosphate transaminase (isomerizing)
MCGIVGDVGKQRAVNILLEGLTRVEYCGYDSAGVAVLERGQIAVVKKIGRGDTLAKLAAPRTFRATTGIGHTRWATHGGVTDANAHPHLSSDGKLALIHNGVIENYVGMKRFLIEKGFTFQSETDTEALVNLFDRNVLFELRRYHPK